MLDKKKPKLIAEPFEKEVYEVLLNIDKSVEFMGVEVFHHRRHTFDNQASVIPDFEIHFDNAGKHFVLLLECKHHADATGSMMKDIEGFIYKSKKIREEHKDSADFVIKPIFLVWVESGEDIPGPVLNEAATQGIPCYSKLLIDQFSQAINALSPSVAFLELIHSYCGIDVTFDPPILSYKCLIGKNFLNPTYTFAMPANDLVRLSYVNRANINKKDLNEAYQRAIKVKRLDEIAKFVVEQSARSKIEVFPNNLVVNATGFIVTPNDGDAFEGKIEIPNKYGTLTVIDGQHRLYSFSKIKEEDLRKSYRFVVTAYSDISHSDQAEIFYNINDKQEGINTDLIMFIQAQLLEKTEGYAAKALLKLDKEEIFTKPLKKGFEERERGAWLRLSTLTYALTEEGLFDYTKTSGGLLQKNRDDQDTPVIILHSYVDYIKRHFQSSWDENRKGFAQSNQGLGIFFILLKKIIETKTKSKDDLEYIDQDTFDEYFRGLSSRSLDTGRLIGKDLSDVRNKSDRRQVANELWNLIR